MGTIAPHLRIVEIGRNISAPYCTKLLADLGADVVKIEQPGTGDPLRSEGSFPLDVSDPTVGGLFEYLNAGKRSAEYDLDAKDNVDAVLNIITGADVLIENLGATVLEQKGLDRSCLENANPHLAVVRISDFGQHGPSRDMPATDFTVQAASGWVSKHLAPGRDPVQVGGRLADFVTGAHAACAALTAYRTASRLGKMVIVDVSKQECLLSTLPQPALTLQTLQELGWGIPEDRVFPVPGVVRCKDGYVGINILTAQHFEDFCNLAGIPEHIPNQMMLQVVGPTFHAFYQDIHPWLEEHGVEEIVDLCQAFRIPAVPVSS